MIDTRALVEVMAKHLPPSGAMLHLLDVGGLAAEALSEMRADLDTIAVAAAPEWPFPADSFDAVIAVDTAPTYDFLKKTLTVLRPGGRFILADRLGWPDESHVRVLEQAGFARILVEAALDSGGVLMRGEKPHTEAHTMHRVQQVAGRDDSADFSTYKGRYVYLLIQQKPNKPVWALRPGEAVEWRAVVADDALLAFSGLPKAVAFMQPAVLAGLIKDVNKVTKFSRETAQGWARPVLLNPSLDALRGSAFSLIDMDPAAAEAPDE